MAQARTERPQPIPFFAVGNVAVGVIAIGNVAFGVVAIGATVACGGIAIGMNTVGALSFGMNAAGPVAVAAINGIGVITYAFVNALGGIGDCLVNAGITPILGIVLAAVYFAIGTKFAKQPPAPDDDASHVVPLAGLRSAGPGTYPTRATFERTGTSSGIVDGDTRLPVELAGTDFSAIEGKRANLTVKIVEEFEPGEEGYREAPEKVRRYVLEDGTAIVKAWTRDDLARVCGRAMQLAAFGSGGACAIWLAT